MTKYQNPFANHDEFAAHVKRHEDFDNWLDERVRVMYAGQPHGYLEGFEASLDGVTLDLERWGEHETVHLSWEEVTDETNETFKVNQEKRQLADKKRAEEAARANREAAVRRLESQLEVARRRLEEDS